MPINREAFEEELDSSDTPTNADRILDFLAIHSDQAFTRSEIAARTDVTRNSVGPVLSRLEAQGLVEHRDRYWTIAEDVLEAKERGLTHSGESDGREDSEKHSGQPTERGGERSGFHGEAVTAFVERATAECGAALAGLYLFGSVARRTETSASDVDILAVVADDSHLETIDDQLLDIAFEIQLDYGIPIEVHTLTEQNFDARKARGEPFVHTIVTEGERYV